jgi:tetratricopeptide (TPR) repeat protein
MVYGIYLQRKGKPKDAVEHLLVAEQFAGDNANLLYNIGLVYVDLGDYNKALTYAHRAYAAGFPLEGLKNRLKRAGKWSEQTTPPTTASSEKEARLRDSDEADADVSKN